jgi:hypothetical protein
MRTPASMAIPTETRRRSSRAFSGSLRVGSTLSTLPLVHRGPRLALRQVQSRPRQRPLPLRSHLLKLLELVPAAWVRSAMARPLFVMMA